MSLNIPEHGEPESNKTASFLKSEACNDTASFKQEENLKTVLNMLELGSGNLKLPLSAIVIIFFPTVTISGPPIHNCLIVFQPISRSCSNLKSDHCIRPLIITLEKQKMTIKMVVSYTGMVLLYSCRTWSSVRVQSWESANDFQ